MAAVRHLLTRRAILGLGLGIGGGALLLAGGGAAWVFSTRAAAPGRTSLSAPEAATMAALADAYFPNDPSNPAAKNGAIAADVDVAAAADAYFASLLPRERRLMRGLLTLWEQWPRLQYGRTFSRLNLQERRAVLRAFETSDNHERRQLASLLRTFVGMTFLEQPGMLAAIGHRFGCEAGFTL